MNLYLNDWWNNLINKPKFRQLELIPLWACDAKCPTCGAWKRDPKIRLSKKQAQAILDYDDFKYLEKVVIEGGETTMWKELNWFVPAAIDKWKKVGEFVIITNGLNVSYIKKLATKLKDYNKRLQWNVSLNGIGETHDISRGVEGAFDKTTKTIKNLVELGYVVHGSHVPFQENVAEFDQVRKYAMELGVRGVGSCFPAISTKFGENLKWKPIPMNEFYKYYRSYINRFAKYSYKYASQYFLWHVNKQRKMPCWAGKTFVNIEPRGYITACCFREDDDFIIGNVTDQKVTIDPKKVEKTVNIIKQGKCAYEEAINVCGDCVLMHTSRRNMPQVLAWKLFHWKI